MNIYLVFPLLSDGRNINPVPTLPTWKNQKRRYATHLVVREVNQFPWQCWILVYRSDCLPGGFDPPGWLSV